MQGTLIITRHQETDWNKLGLWQGRMDRHLTEEGTQALSTMAGLLHGVPLTRGYISTLVRTKETMDGILASLGRSDMPVTTASALDERDYGDYAGKNKWEMQKILGEESFFQVRRGWDVPIPNGETLRDVYARVIPFYTETVVPQLVAGETILIVAHGNSLRALTKYIEDISDDTIGSVEFTFGEMIFYTIDADGKMTTKEIKTP